MNWFLEKIGFNKPNEIITVASGDSLNEALSNLDQLNPGQDYEADRERQFYCYTCGWVDISDYYNHSH